MLTKTNWTIMLLHGNYDVSKTAPKLHTHTHDANTPTPDGRPADGMTRHWVWT